MVEQQLEELPIIASITKQEQIEAVLKSKVKRVNLMTGDIMTLSSIITDLHKAGKQVHVHLEMVSGLGRDLSTVQYLSKTFGIDGIVSTKSNMIAAARQVGIRSIQRIFGIDTAAIDTAIKMIGQVQPDEVELMPGLMPRVIKDLKQKISCPLIVGGLIRHEEEIRQALEYGADYVSIGDKRYWL
ncbi:glycerol-3-phosphate responsive antiterminator [Paenibacillus sp. FSL W7-1287]|uniref:glycerol-3-phosphate responsive antiterminator n=1 Tax=Paenibacillus sp. FSL W7-1287 TaxID=2954538 RepID=UPI0030F6BE70